MAARLAAIRPVSNSFGGLKRGLSFALFALLSLVSLALTPLPATASSAAKCDPHTVFLRGEFGQARFTVEVVDTVATRAQGLMNRAKMARSSGMIFIYEQPQSVTFWMKNTLIALDMLFVDGTGMVTRVHSNATPHDLTPIVGGDDILAVLEINGGLAALMGIEPGSQMQHPAFASETAVWPCP